MITQRAASAAGILLTLAAATASGAPPTTTGVASWQASPVPSGRLAGLRGGSDMSGSVVENGKLKDATATNVVTGSNSVSGGSFANASGLPTVIQNSGANVLIQSSTVINVQFKP